MIKDVMPEVLCWEMLKRLFLERKNTSAVNVKSPNPGLYPWPCHCSDGDCLSARSYCSGAWSYPAHGNPVEWLSLGFAGELCVASSCVHSSDEELYLINICFLWIFLFFVGRKIYSSST